MAKISRILKWTGIIILILVVVWLALGWWWMLHKQKIQTAIDFINSKEITLNDVMGKNLPPKPIQVLNDATIAGFDVNNNYIRDDVELAIFEKYPNSARIRAAMLQYAQALQLELTQVFNSQTLIPAIQKENLAYKCLGQAVDNVDNSQKEVENLVLNTEVRNKALSDAYNYLIGHGLSEGPICDVDLSSLSN